MRLRVLGLAKNVKKQDEYEREQKVERNNVCGKKTSNINNEVLKKHMCLKAQGWWKNLKIRKRRRWNLINLYKDQNILKGFKHLER